MYAQNTGMIFVYDLKWGGGVAMHYVTWEDGIITVSIDSMERQQPFFETMKRMHENDGHPMVQKHRDKSGEVWAVQIGGGDQSLMLHCLNMALDEALPQGRKETDENPFSAN